MQVRNIIIILLYGLLSLQYYICILYTYDVDESAASVYMWYCTVARELIFIMIIVLPHGEGQYHA